ncbi:MAG: DHH family phosphoesterase, partial [Nanoarchaeota archaeon]
MELEIGTEERFLEFVSKSKGKKIALISHTDLDGITSAKIANEIFHADIFKFVEYTDLNIKLAEELKNLGVERIVFTDINVQDEKFVAVLESFAEVLIIDHHKTSDLNSEKTFLIKGENGYSAGYLCYELFSKIKNLEKFDWLVACSCISDY